MERLENEAKQHFDKLTQSLAYHEKRLTEEIPEGIKFQVRREIAAIKFAMQYAKEALEQRGVKL